MRARKHQLLHYTALSAIAGIALTGMAHAAPGLAAPQAPAAAADAIPVKSPAAMADGSYVGRSVDTKYGPVQVSVTISGGRIATVDAVKHPGGKKASRRINGRAIPVLERSAIRSQSAQVDFVSGATLTAKAFSRSLASALAKAGQ